MQGDSLLRFGQFQHKDAIIPSSGLISTGIPALHNPFARHTIPRGIFSHPQLYEVTVSVDGCARRLFAIANAEFICFEPTRALSSHVENCRAVTLNTLVGLIFFVVDDDLNWALEDRACDVERMVCGRYFPKSPMRYFKCALTASMTVMFACSIIATCLSVCLKSPMA